MNEPDRAEETTPLDRCEVCGAAAEWSIRYSNHDARRDPPFRFFDRTHCDAHLPDDARAVIPDWAAGN